MIGWYHTGPKLRAADLEINELFKRFIARPVMVIVDVRPHTVGIPTDAYFAVEEIKDVRFSGPRCKNIHTTHNKTRLGRHRDAQDFPACTFGDRSGRGGRNRRRALTARYQGFDYDDASDSRLGAARVAPRTSSASLGRTALPRRRRTRRGARQPPGRLPPPGRAQPTPRPR